MDTWLQENVALPLHVWGRFDNLPPTGSAKILKREASLRLDRLPIVVGERRGSIVVRAIVLRLNKKRQFLCVCDCGREVVRYANTLRSRSNERCGLLCKLPLADGTR